MKSFSALLAVALPSAVVAWGNDGHEIVGYVAMNLLGPNALAFVQSSLGSTYNESLGPAATWADSVKYDDGWTWSKPLHFVDAEDDPLGGSCSVEQSRDCADGCILTAIANYTTRVGTTSLSASERQIALKFLDHFLGDIGQPLHVEAYEVGGNDITVTCNNTSDNLHSVWDTGIIEKNMASSHNNSITTYASSLVTSISSSNGKFHNLLASWLSCTSTTATTTSKRGFEQEHTIQMDVDTLLGRRNATNEARATAKPLQCPLVWAADANTYDCSFVFNFTSTQDLCKGVYFDAAIPIIDLQLAKQGYRLAAWLNVIFDGAPLLP